MLSNICVTLSYLLYPKTASCIYCNMNEIYLFIYNKMCYLSMVDLYNNGQDKLLCFVTL